MSSTNGQPPLTRRQARDLERAREAGEAVTGSISIVSGSPVPANMPVTTPSPASHPHRPGSHVAAPGSVAAPAPTSVPYAGGGPTRRELRAQRQAATPSAPAPLRAPQPENDRTLSEALRQVSDIESRQTTGASAAGSAAEQTAPAPSAPASAPAAPVAEPSAGAPASHAAEDTGPVRPSAAPASDASPASPASPPHAEGGQPRAVRREDESGSHTRVPAATAQVGDDASPIRRRSSYDTSGSVPVMSATPAPSSTPTVFPFSVSASAATSAPAPSSATTVADASLAAASAPEPTSAPSASETVAPEPAASASTASVPAASAPAAPAPADLGRASAPDAAGSATPAEASPAAAVPSAAGDDVSTPAAHGSAAHGSAAHGSAAHGSAAPQTLDGDVSADPAAGAPTASGADDEAAGAPARPHRAGSAIPASTPQPTAYVPPTGHWSTQADLDDDDTIESVGSHFGTRTGQQNALILNDDSLPDITGALNATGEVIITGSIDLPRSLAATGAHNVQRIDGADIDHMLEESDRETASNDASPVRASRAVSANTSTRAVVLAAGKSKSTRLPIIATICGIALIVVIVGGIIVAWSTGLLSH